MYLIFRPHGSMFGMDLAALNVQRGRDHEIGSYEQVRLFCNLSPLPETFDQTGPSELSTEIWQKLKSLYQYPSDIELFPGGLSETPSEPGKLGPTFSCIIGEQFRNLKFGDRFFFTHENTGMVKFCHSDLELLRKRTLRDIICENTEIDELPMNVFKVESPENPSVSCRNQINRLEIEELCLFGANKQARELKPPVSMPENSGKKLLLFNFVST